MPLAAPIEQRIREIVEEEGLILLEILHRGQKNSSVLEIIVDAESGATLEKVAAISRAVGRFLDTEEEEGEEPPIAGRYRLEVSTPGLDRPLEHLWQYRKNVGRLLKLVHRIEEGKSATDLFRLLEVTPTGMLLDLIKKSGKGRKSSVEQMEIPFDDIEKVIVEPEI